jgi:5-methylcytosine-specific restriction endonuclease McrA
VRPPEDDYDERFAQLVDVVLSSGVPAARHLAEALAYRQRATGKRTSPPKELQACLFRRDRFRCRYCGRRCIPSPILEIVHRLYPDEVPWTEGWKGGATHPVFITRSPVLDHVDPGAWSGLWRDDDNLVTACWVCNAIKSDLTLSQLGWDQRPLPISDDLTWDGLTSRYRQLWETAGHPDPSRHKPWLDVFERLAAAADAGR